DFEAALLDGPEDLRAPLRGIGLDARIGPVDLPEGAARGAAVRLHPLLEELVGARQVAVRADVPGDRGGPARELAREDAPLRGDGFLHRASRLEIERG